MRDRRQTLPTVLALTFVALLITPFAAAAAGLPATITLTPETPGPGAQVEVVGLDFVAGQDVQIQVTTMAGPVHLGTARTEDGGYFRQLVTLPADAPAGYWELRATGAGGIEAVQLFEAGEVATVAPGANAQATTTAVADGGSTGSDLLVLLVLGLLIGGITAAAVFVYHQTHRARQEPGMSAGDDPFWGSAPSDP
jgi:hypothetical protein